MFKPLTKANLTGIIDNLIAGLSRRLAERGAGGGLNLRVTDAAKELIIDKGYDPIYGARPLKRYLQSSAETLIAKLILAGNLKTGATIVLDAKNGELECRAE